MTGFNTSTAAGERGVKDKFSALLVSTAIEQCCRNYQCRKKRSIVILLPFFSKRQKFFVLMSLNGSKA